MALPLLHLRSLNPHVENALQSCGLASVMAPRQPKPLLPLPRQQAMAGGHGSGGGGGEGSMVLVGVSAFAFQGTNAHAVVGAAMHGVGPRMGGGAAPLAAGPEAAALVAAAAGKLQWQRQRVWVHPAAVPLVGKAMMISKVEVRTGCCALWLYSK